MHLLWICVLPQLLLLLMNLRMMGTIWGEMNTTQHTSAWAIFTFELVMLGLVGAFVASRARSRRPVERIIYLPLLLLSAGYLFATTLQFERLVPASVSAWILPPETLLYYQCVFVMPMAFFSAMQLACFETKWSRSKDAGYSTLLLIGIPLALVGGTNVLRFFRIYLGGFGFLSPILSIFWTVAAIAAMLRLVLIGYTSAIRQGPVMLTVFTAVVAIGGPIGGLLLNRETPFPVDLQSQGIYLLAAVNGVILLLPRFRNLRAHRAVWLAQCFLFPFTLYFFVVFLPYLPLSLLAMFAAGAGFLILAPTALFLLHGKRILDGLQHELLVGKRSVTITCGIVAVMAIPAGYTINALYDQRVLGQAIEYAYSPNYRDGGFRGSPRALSHSLTGLRDFKAGLELPFLSDYYNWIVFDGLVLPDEKMQHLHRLFLGGDLPPPKMKEAGFSMFGRRHWNGLFTETRRGPVPFSHDVQIQSISTNVEPEGSFSEKATVTLNLENKAPSESDLENNAPSESEFVTILQVPQSILVSGFWLHIGDERVPGRIFEKKSALWVYQKIRDVTRRDPGILLYTGPEQLELRVFPFSGNETRTVELEFLRPTGSAATVRIGSQSLALGKSDLVPRMTLANAGDAGTALAIPADLLASLPTITRRPYLHFIIDRSATATLDGEALRETLVRVAKQFPEAREYRISEANFDVQDLSPGLLAIDTLATWNAKTLSALPKRGGFAQDRALKRAMLQGADDLRTATPEALGRFPLPIVIRGAKTQPILEGHLEDFGNLSPDMSRYFVTNDGGMLTAQEWSKSESSGADDERRVKPVAILRSGKTLTPVDVTLGAPLLIPFPAGTKDVEAWDPVSQVRKTLSCETIGTGERYARGVGAWLQQLALTLEPALGKEALQKLVVESRASGVIVPATSYIVVENSAQWKKLEQTEKKKLANNNALEMEETPEPGTTLLLVCGGALLLAHRWRRAHVARG